MASGSLGNGDKAPRLISQINVTPLVDIMLVLLIIFMVTASYIVRDSIDVKLPEASTGARQQVSLLAVSVAADGGLKLNGSPATVADIRRFIGQQQKNKRSLEAVIAADKRVPHGRVVQVIDLVRAEGVTKFAINVLKAERSRAK